MQNCTFACSQPHGPCAAQQKGRPRERETPQKWGAGGRLVSDSIACSGLSCDMTPGWVALFYRRLLARYWPHASEDGRQAHTCCGPGCGALVVDVPKPDVLRARVGARVVDRVIVHAVCGQRRCRWQRKWLEFGRKGFVWDLCVKGKRGGGGGRGRGAYSRRGSSSARSRSTYGSRHCGRTARG